MSNSSKSLNNLLNDFINAKKNSLTEQKSSSLKTDSKCFLEQIREHILIYGIVDEHSHQMKGGFGVNQSGDESSVRDANENDFQKRKQEMCLRGRAQKILLGVDKVDSKLYSQLIKKEKSSFYQKIRRDSHRTFPRDTNFQSVVPEQRIVRVLNSFVHLYGDDIGYVQGMNAIAAPFLYTMPEVDAFFAFCKFVNKCFPLYQKNYVCGARAGCKLVDQCLKKADRELYEHLKKMKLDCEIYGFHSVQSLSASIPPFSELIKIQDLLIAFGPHLNVLCVVAQVVCKRKQLLECKTGNDCQTILNSRKVAHQKALAIKRMIMQIHPLVSADQHLYQKILRHSYDENVTNKINKDQNGLNNSNSNLIVIK